MVSLSASARLLQSANIGLAGASIARKRATAGMTAPNPSLRNSKSYLTSRTENKRKGKGRI